MEKDEFVFREAFKSRTKQMALRVVKLFQALPKTGESQIPGKQLLRSATSVAANYRAACRSRSTNEFFAKICIVVEEADETIFWLELLSESGILPSIKLESLMEEATEILKITSTAKKNAKAQKNN
jgi:four helix bundle protein